LLILPLDDLLPRRSWYVTPQLQIRQDRELARRFLEIGTLGVRKICNPYTRPNFTSLCRGSGNGGSSAPAGTGYHGWESRGHCEIRQHHGWSYRSV